MSQDNFILVAEFCGKWYAADMSFSQDDPINPDVRRFFDALMRDSDYAYPEGGRWVDSKVPIAFDTREAAFDWLDALGEKIKDCGSLCEYGISSLSDPIPPTQENRQYFRKLYRQVWDTD